MPIVITNRTDKSWSKTFESRNEAIAWIKQGIEWSEGSEQDRYYHVLWKLEDGVDSVDLYQFD